MRRLVFGLAVLGMFAVVQPQTQADDQAVAQRVVETIQQHKKTGALKGFGLDLQVENGVVWVKGEVANAQQHLLLIQSVAQLEGVVDVVNDVKIRAPKPTPVAQPTTDIFGGIAQGVKNALGLEGNADAKPEVAPEPVTETTATEDPTPLPAVFPEPVGAVVRVKQVRPVTPEINDDAIAQTIGQQLGALKDTGKLENFNVQISVSGGTVWVKGFAADEAQQASILGIAQNIGGVDKVVNDMIIRRPAAFQIASVTQIPVPAPAPAFGVATAPVAPQPAPVALQPAPVALQPAPVAPQPALVAHAAAMRAPVASAPVQMIATPSGIAQARYEQPNLPAYAWPSYAAAPNYGQVNYPKQYSASAWPYIGPFYPYPQVPLGWRKVSLEWTDGWWFLDFESN
jgi:osmotically-inducible protein OsmY